MANEQNLIPLDKRTKSEQREIQSSGGVASGAARRRKRSLREAADLYLSLPVADGRARNRLARAGVEPEDIDNQMAILAGLTKAAIAGDSRAAKALFDILGTDDGRVAPENNLLEALTGSTNGEVSTDDLPELQQAAEHCDDVVEPVKP